MHFGASEETGITSGRMRAALEILFLNSAVDANGNFHQPKSQCSISCVLKVSVPCEVMMIMPDRLSLCAPYQ